MRGFTALPVILYLYRSFSTDTCTNTIAGSGIRVTHNTLAIFEKEMMELGIVTRNQRRAYWKNKLAA